MRKRTEKIFSFAIYSVCLFVAIELIINYFAFYYLFPIKNADSFGYVVRKSKQIAVPLNKYSTRRLAQLALPYELIMMNFNDRELIKEFDPKTNKYGYKDKFNHMAIKPTFVDAQDFDSDYAIVAIEKDNLKKYGTIDKHGKWIIEPKYSHICPFEKYYTRVCLDSDHCGVIDRYGNEITLLSYKTDKLNCKGEECEKKFCIVGKDNNVHCNYFL